MFIGFGTAVNVVAIIAGSAIGLLVGHRLPARTRQTVTDGLGLVTILIGLLSAWKVTSPALGEAVGTSAPMLIVLGSLLIGGIIGSLTDIEYRLEAFGGWLRGKLIREDGADRDAAEHAARARFIEGFVSASLIFCIGPLTVLGSLSDGLGLGADQLILKSVMDAFASIAFAASLGVGVMASALAVGLVQGGLTLVGLAFGSFLPAAHLDALTATGGLLLVGLSFRLLNIKQVPVGNMLPALVIAPLLTQAVAALI